MPMDGEKSDTEGDREGPLRLGHKTLRAMARISPNAVVVVDTAGRIVLANGKAGALFGHDEHALSGQPIETLVPPQLHDHHRQQRAAYMRSPAERPMGQGRDLWGRHSNGREIPIEIALTPIETPDGSAVIASVTSLAERRDLEQQLRQERDFSNAIIDGLPAVFYVLDRQGGFLRWNRNLELVTGLDAEQLARTNASELFTGNDRERIGVAIGEAFDTGSAEVEAALQNAEGGYTPYYFTGLRIELGGQPCLTGAGIDISARKVLEEELNYQASHDPLTGLMNRRSFEERLAREVSRAKRLGAPLSLVMFDIDGFKAINDTHGHLVGDRILTDLAAVLKQKVRGTDTLARWGGEEFMLLLAATALDGAAVVAEAVRTAVSGTEFTGPERITVSLGVTDYRHGEPVESLIERLDKALYAAKESGRDQVVTR